MLYFAGCLTFLKIVPKDRAKEICSTNDVLRRGKRGVKEKERIRIKGIGICSYISKLITEYETEYLWLLMLWQMHKHNNICSQNKVEKKNKEGKKG
jgi:hypothetical protein